MELKLEKNSKSVKAKLYLLKFGDRLYLNSGGFDQTITLNNIKINEYAERNNLPNDISYFIIGIDFWVNIICELDSTKTVKSSKAEICLSHEPGYLQVISSLKRNKKPQYTLHNFVDWCLWELRFDTE